MQYQNYLINAQNWSFHKTISYKKEYLLTSKPNYDFDIFKESDKINIKIVTLLMKPIRLLVMILRVAVMASERYMFLSYLWRLYNEINRRVAIKGSYIGKFLKLCKLKYKISI